MNNYERNITNKCSLLLSYEYKNDVKYIVG